MDNQKASPKDTQTKLTQHTMLVVWGLCTQQIGLIDRLMRIKLRQKSRFHQPQTTLLEFFVAMLAGLPHVKNVSRSAHPLVQDGAVAQAWQQPAWTDYSGVSQTMQQVSAAGADAITAALKAIEQLFIRKGIDLDLQAVWSSGVQSGPDGLPRFQTSRSGPDVRC